MVAYPFSLKRSKLLRFVTFFYLYVMQGIPAGFALTAVANYLAAEGVEAMAIGQFVAIVGFPWTIQFIWGPLIDKYQSSAMGQRKPWVLLSQFLSFVASLGILWVNDPSSQITLLSAAFFIHSLFASIQDASVDAMAITIVDVSERGRINAFMRGGMLTGSALGAAGTAYLIRFSSFQQAALAQSLLLFILMVITFFIKEKPQDTLLPTKTESISREHKNSVSIITLFKVLFRELTSSQNLWIFASIIVVYICLSVFIRAYSIHLIQVLQWKDTELSVLSGTAGTLVALIVVLIGGYIADKYGARRLLMFMILFIAVFLLFLSGLTWFFYSKVTITVGLVVWYMMDPAYSVASMPILMALCHKGIEGSQFTTYMALVNLSDVVGAYLSGYALHWLTAPAIGLICSALLFVNLWAVRMLVRKRFFSQIA